LNIFIVPHQWSNGKFKGIPRSTIIQINGLLAEGRFILNPVQNIVLVEGLYPGVHGVHAGGLKLIDHLLCMIRLTTEDGRDIRGVEPGPDVQSGLAAGHLRSFRPFNESDPIG
jgi:hypothetical protein